MIGKLAAQQERAEATGLPPAANLKAASVGLPAPAPQAHDLLAGYKGTVLVRSGFEAGQGAADFSLAAHRPEAELFAEQAPPPPAVVLLLHVHGESVSAALREAGPGAAAAAEAAGGVALPVEEGPQRAPQPPPPQPPAGTGVGSALIRLLSFGKAGATGQVPASPGVDSAAAAPGAPPAVGRSLSRRFSRSMRRLGASLRKSFRRSLHRSDSPPVPEGRRLQRTRRGGLLLPRLAPVPEQPMEEAAAGVASVGEGSGGRCGGSGGGCLRCLC